MERLDVVCGGDESWGVQVEHVLVGAYKLVAVYTMMSKLGHGNRFGTQSRSGGLERVSGKEDHEDLIIGLSM